MWFWIFLAQNGMIVFTPFDPPQTQYHSLFQAICIKSKTKWVNLRWNCRSINQIYTPLKSRWLSHFISSPFPSLLWPVNFSVNEARSNVSMFSFQKKSQRRVCAALLRKEREEGMSLFVIKSLQDRAQNRQIGTFSLLMITSLFDLMFLCVATRLYLHLSRSN